MDDKSKSQILMFLRSLEQEMENSDDLYESKSYSSAAERGYFFAVDKMKFFINKFVDDEIKNAGK